MDVYDREFPLVDIDLTLSVEASRSFRCQKAADGLDIDVAKKLTHRFQLTADLDSPYNVGLIVGASGSGKTTLATHLWGAAALERTVDGSLPVIDQFPKEFEYKACVRLLTGVGLTQVPCWIRPAFTLSNGQRERAEIALKMASSGEFVAIDEWTSVVDRTVAKIMSNCVARWARKTGKRVVLLSCHRDVIEWLAPDWIVDCDKQLFDDRRSLRPERKEKLQFDIRQCDRDSWRFFSKYHYLSERLPGGLIFTFGLFLGADQVGFQCFANYVPNKYAGRRVMVHSNRTVIHPDYVGLGLGIKLINETSKIMQQRGYDVRAKFSSAPVFEAMQRDPLWKLLGVSRKHKIVRGGTMERTSGFRLDVTTYEFQFICPC